MTAPALSDEQLGELTESTIGHYDRNARDFWEGTKDHDVSQNIDALLRHLDSSPPLSILDLGCGPGRDLATFKSLGHHPTGLEGSPSFCQMARALTGCPVLHQDFLQMDLPSAGFHGVFANATLFHVPLQELPRVLGELRESLKPGGVLFSSNPRGPDQEGWRGDRYGSYHTEKTWHRVMTSAVFIALETYYRPPGLPQELQPWLASVWRRS